MTKRVIYLPDPSMETGWNNHFVDDHRPSFDEPAYRRSGGFDPERIQRLDEDRSESDEG